MDIISKEKNKLINFFKDNIALILLCLYTLSFINYYIYYKSFDISIFNYVGLNDLLFFSLEYIFKIFLLIFLCEILISLTFSFLYIIIEKYILFVVKRKGLLYLKSNKQNRNRIDKVLSRNFDFAYKNFRIVILLLSIFILGLFPNTLIVLPTFLIYLIFALIKFNKDETKLVLLTSSTIIIVLFTILTTLVDSYNKRFEKDDYTISFNEENTFVSTDKKISCYNYLGETSSNIFLYDIENKESVIYNKSSLTNLKIKNLNDIDETILKIKNNSLIKFYIDAFKSEK